MSEEKTISIILTSTFGADEWQLKLPANRPVQAIIIRIRREPEFGFKETDDAGTPVPYRLIWKEGDRMLGESETLEGAGVKDGHTLVMTHEARAGKAACARN